MIKAGIIGATGYAGAELVRLLLGHPRVCLAGLTSRTYKGQLFPDVYPHLAGYLADQCQELDLNRLVEEADVVFTALPHGHSMEVARAVVDRDKRLVDLGADFRLRDGGLYEQWYKVVHTEPEILGEAVYGLPEINRANITGARVLANPGCYPTASILAMAPAMQAGIADPESVIIDAKSGVSGAGRGLSLRVHFAEANENLQAYNVGIHRHTPEIEQALSGLAGEDITVSFTPHLVPMTRGILATAYFKLNRDIDAQGLHEIYRGFYRDASFVRVMNPGLLPQTKAVAGSNHCDIGLVVDPRTGRAVVLAAIDNLIKGAAGQAIQNMNLMFGFSETDGLDRPGLYP